MNEVDYEQRFVYQDVQVGKTPFSCVLIQSEYGRNKSENDANYVYELFFQGGSDSEVRNEIILFPDS